MPLTVNFTKNNIASLPLPQGNSRLYVQDEKISYLRLQVTSTGNKTFQVYRKVNWRNSPIKVRIGQYPEISIENARKKAQLINGKIAEGVDPNAQNRSKAKTVLEICQDNLEAKKGGDNLKRKRKGLSKSTLEKYARCVAILEQEKQFSNRFSHKVKIYDANCFLDKFSKTPARAQDLKFFLSNSYDFALKKGTEMLEYNPFANIERQYELPESNELPRHTDAEIIRIMKYLNDAETGNLHRFVNPYWILFVRFMILNGPRPNDILTIKRDWNRQVVDPRTGQSQQAIIQEKTKTGRKIIYISDSLHKYIQATPEIHGNPFLFPSSISQSGHMVNYKTEFNHMRQETGIDKEPYGIRRWFARTAKKAFQGDIQKMQELQGWSTPAMADRYAGNDEELLDMVITKNAPLCYQVDNHVQNILSSV